MSKKQAAPGLTANEELEDVEGDELPQMLDDDAGDVPDDWAKPAGVEYATAEELTESADDERATEDVYLPSSKKWVQIHELNRGEAIKVSDTKGGTDRERKIICWGLAQPQLTFQTVEGWHRKAGAGDVQVLVEAISELSGMVENSRKRAYQRFRETAGS